VIGVHFKSDPTDFRPRRDAQAAFAVELVRRELATDPVALVAVAGDFNAPASALPALRSALPRGSLSVAMDQVPAVLRYSYVFDGIAQPIDQILVSPALAARLLDARAIHLNADLPDPAPGEAGVPTRISDHDPVVASFGETASYRVFVPRVP
jgi:predicted extracellular nuclease